ncbi:MAG: carboxyl-terminal protease [Acidimicrobiia bacterium]|nr:carboxyl-terminal protease [Acidimicrobiia bacterium]
MKNRRFQFAIVSASTCLLVVLMLGMVLGRGNAAEDAYRHFAVFAEVISRIKSDYVEEPDMKNVTLGALNGMLEAIDPYASYLSPEQYKAYLKSKETSKAGVGLILARRIGYVGVVDSIPGSPAAILGLSTGDVLETINNVSTRDMPLAYAEMLLAGDPGTKVDMTVLRWRRGTDAQQISLVRAPIQYPPASAKMLPGEFGYLQLASLEKGKVKEAAAGLRDLAKQGAKKLVLDLRGNASGAPEEGIALADLFLDKGLITYLLGQKVSREESQASAETTLWKLPMVVITNRGTAGGAEVAAAALLDNKRAEVVGERTYGNAALRKALTLEDGAAVILSTAKFYSPAGKAIQDNAVTPSAPVAEAEPSEDDEDAPPILAPPEPKPDQDKTLQKAIEVLTIGLEASAAEDNKRAEQAAQQQENERRERIQRSPPLVGPPPPKQ